MFRPLRHPSQPQLAMIDTVSSEIRSKMMRSVRRANTNPEIAVRRLAFSFGYRFRLHRRDLPGNPDIVFPKLKSVILVHGCFWHQHSNCPRAKQPTSNIKFWRRKLRGNVIRDKATVRALRKLGWRVLVVWECQISRQRSVAKRILKFLQQRNS
jgi:DNA mismatch endonuclease (patch repair protein)